LEELVRLMVDAELAELEAGGGPPPDAESTGATRR
jgi:hypothetical protein